MENKKYRYRISNQMPEVYDAVGSAYVKIERTVSDEKDTVLKKEVFTYETLQEALEAIQKMYKMDKMMYDVLTKGKSLANRSEALNSGYCYTIKVCKVYNVRIINCGLVNPHQYAAEAFCLEGDSNFLVTQQ